MPRRNILCLLWFAAGAPGYARGAEPPGVVIHHIRPAREVYVGSPGIAVLPDGSYLAKHDGSGPKSSERDSGTTQVFRSRDRGRTRQHAATVRGMYRTLSNPVLPGHRDPDPGRVRNAVALMRSPDLRRWEIRCIVLYHPDVDKHGFQYLDWLFEEPDIIAVARTAGGDGADAAPRQRDADYLTFHRFRGFREFNMNDGASGAGPDGSAGTPRDVPAAK